MSWTRREHQKETHSTQKLPRLEQRLPKENSANKRVSKAVKGVEEGAECRKSFLIMGKKGFTHNFNETTKTFIFQEFILLNKAFDKI